MKKIHGPERHTAPNGWGRDSTTMRTVYVVEESDVGIIRPDKGGHGQPGYTFRRDDVGRVVEVITLPGAGPERDGRPYHCWGFGTLFTQFPARVCMKCLTGDYVQALPCPHHEENDHA